MLYDKNFLLKLDSYHHKVIYARVTALTFQENPIEYIEGRVTGGSISIDGASAVRRTCSLTIAAPEFNFNDYYWGLNTKFKLEIGVENHVDPKYPEIIWFQQGIYLITSFNVSRNTTSFTITLQGKDKMCLLNGDVGGSLESSIDFGTIQEEDINGNWTITQVPIPEIIKNMVHTYAGEPYHNIIINDLDTYGLELLEYRYDIPMFLYRQHDNSIYNNVILNDVNTQCKIYKKEFSHYDEIQKKNQYNFIEVQDEPMFTLDEIPFKYLDAFTDRLLPNNDGTYVMKIKNKQGNWEQIDGEDGYFNMAKIKYGQTAGYRFTDLVYAGDLIANVGDSLTSVLDKIKTMLVEFEYFYNLEGQFVFQKKKSFKQAIWQFNEEEKSYLPPEYSYEFYGSNLISAFSNNPNLLNLKNDYSIWGEKEGISGAKIPIHLRYAIDKKPLQYSSIIVQQSEVDDYNNKYGTVLPPQLQSITYKKADSYNITGNVIECDWREIIYQMAMDYYHYNFLDDFELRIAEANPDFYPSGRTGYEQYYVDMQGFWRELYNPDVANEEQTLQNKINQTSTRINDLTIEIQKLKGNIYLYDAGRGDFAIKPGDSTTVQIEKWEKRREWIEQLKNAEEALEIQSQLLTELQLSFDKLTEEKGAYYLTNEMGLLHWNIAVHEQPESLNFWFDFLDTEGELQQFSVKNIGNRSKPVNDTAIKSIYFRETPSVIYLAEDEDMIYGQESGYKYVKMPDKFENMFSISAQGKGAKDKLDELLYQHGYCVESVSITTVPIYHLEPNTRIYLHDDDLGLDGDYIVSKITVPLTYNGTMQITATKAAENTII